MAGFFGLFNYEKEGPGISKNAPKKKTFIVFFETFFRNFWKFITINLVHNLLSLPLLTNGLAAAGITNVTRNIARDKHSFGLSDYFETIKKNWKQSLIAGIINLLVYLILGFDLYFFSQIKNNIVCAVSCGFILSLMLIFTFMNYFIWTLIITFNFKLKAVYKNSFKFALINFKNNFICFLTLVLVHAIYVGIAYLLWNYIILVLTIEMLIYLVTYPAFKYLLVQFCTFPSIKKCIIDPYYREHPEEDIEKRRALGIDIEEEDKTEKEEKTFSDEEAQEDEEDDSPAIFNE